MISVFDLFSIGIGPSSSHTVGPMRATGSFISYLKAQGHFSQVECIVVELFGSLALTGKGHGTDIAMMLGLEGETPEAVDPNAIADRVAAITKAGSLKLEGKRPIPFVEGQHLIFYRDRQLPYHPNGMRFTAYGPENHTLCSRIYYSVGGGFVVDEAAAKRDDHLGDSKTDIPYPFSSADQLLAICLEEQISIAEVVMANEMTLHSREQVVARLRLIWETMRSCVVRGCSQEGVLPGGLNVRRRAKRIYQSLLQRQKNEESSHGTEMEWTSLWALAVNEENAAGGRVVTAPTNGAAGVIPAVLHYYQKFTPDPSEEGIFTFLLTAGAIGILYKLRASISAAEMGCMGEVGVACSMAAAGLTAALGGSAQQTEDAAEIGMEHNLGLTCDPVKGLVQIPCIERNTMGAAKAKNAALLALLGDGQHRVTLDQVIATMYETGMNMKSHYKETSLGGLAVNVPEC